MAQDSSRPEFWNARYHDQVTPWDAGKVPPDLAAFAPRLAHGTRILIPGCGSGYEVGFLASAGFSVLAIDFSPEAIAAAQQVLGPQASHVVLADFFEVQDQTFDVVYERAFLCALPRKLWTRYAEHMAALLAPGKLLAGFFFYGDNPRGPPFGTSSDELHGLLDPAFDQIEDRGAVDSLPVFQGGERWQVWRRH